ncbi:MAG: hypothetical protein Greene041679_369 [Parcubacteria group bacterium Greene0416_79]|nr:MAG: hypothetical protein Greene041679_369 [Parcubacteria group bacterium Greene0416_79]
MHAIESEQSPFHIPPTPKFVEEIAARKTTEAREGKTVLLFSDINPSELVADDEMMFERVMRGEQLPSDQEFSEYRKRVIESGNKSRKGLCAYLANMLMVQRYRKKEL